MGTFTYFFQLYWDRKSEYRETSTRSYVCPMPTVCDCWLRSKIFNARFYFVAEHNRSITDKCFMDHHQLITGHWNGLSNSMASGHHLRRVGSELVIGQSVRLDRFLGIFLTYSAPWTHLRTRPIPALGPSGLPTSFPFFWHPNSRYFKNMLCCLTRSRL